MKKIVNSLCLLLLVLVSNHALAQCTLPPNAIYVTPTGTGNGSAGSPTNIVSALTMHRTNPARNPILMAGGEYNLSQILYIPGDLTMEGGYTNTNGSWAKTPANVTTLKISPPFLYSYVEDIPRDIFTDLHYEDVEVASLIGLYLDSVQNVKIKDFNIDLWTNGSVYLESRDGFSVYGIYGYRAKNVEVSNMKITTVSAQRGGGGEDGRNGYSAIWSMAGGLEPNNALTTNLEFPVYKLRDESDYRRAGGKGGFGGPVQQYVQCQGPPCVTSGCMPESPPPTGRTGGSSATVGGGAGGACGDPCKLDCNYQDYLTAATAATTVLGTVFGTHEVASPLAHPGLDGYNGVDGASGYGVGTPAEFERFYVPGKGDRGQHGSGGSGGGGGGAGGIRVLAVPSMPPGAGVASIPFQVMQLTLRAAEFIALAAGQIDAVCGGEVLNLSTRGGHGGGGGEGGQGGGGGGGGGSVYGIYGNLCTNVAFGNITYDLGEAGEGGDGGMGSDGGNGGQGVDGPELYAPAGFFSNRGGKGGKGGDGGRGGDGARGADGKRMETFGLVSGWYGSGLVLSIDTSRICTNSIIPIVKNANTNMSVFLNNWSSNVTTHVNTPTYREVSVAMTGALYISQSNISFPNQYQSLGYQVTKVRALPNFNVPAKICQSDSIRLMPTDTTMPGYRWRLYLNDSLMLETSRKYFTFNPTVKNGSTVYKIELQSYEACCGWSVPVTKHVAIDMPVNITMTAPYNSWPYRFCKGTDSVGITLNGTPSQSVNGVTVYPGLVWNTGVVNKNKIFAPQDGSYSATYTSPYGCVTQSPTVNVTIVLDPPVGPATVYSAYNLCNFDPVAIYPSHPDAWKYNFYIDSTSQFPIASNVLSYVHEPYFGYYPAPDSVMIWVQPVSYEGCRSATRTKMIMYHEKYAPAIVEPFQRYYSEIAGPNCKKAVNYQVPVGSDNCESYVEVTRLSGQYPGYEFPIGTHTVIHRVRDLFGNYQDVTTTIEVRDGTPPVISNPWPTLTFDADPGTCGKIFNTPLAPSAYDNCEGVIVPTTYYSGLITGDTLFGVGENRIYYTFSDSSGNSAMTTLTFTVVDNQPPIFNCPSDKIFYIKDSDTSAFVYYTTPTVTDNCTMYNSTTFVSGFGQWGIHPLGYTTETYSATDEAGHTTTCSFNLLVTDSIKPEITCGSVWFLADTGKSYTTITYPTPTAIDNLPGVSVQWEFIGKYSGDTASIGTHYANYKATDAYGNIATCQVEIIVSDREGPRLNCPNNVTVNNDNGACTAAVNYTIAPAYDNDGSYYNATLFSGLPSGAAFPLGTTNVVYRTADALNNRSYCSFEVTVVDNVAPNFTTPCPNDTTINFIPNLCTAYMQLPALVGVDNTCVEPYGGFVSGSISGYFPMGTTTQLYRIWDVSGNERTCTYNVHVVDNNVLTATCPSGNLLVANPGSCTAYAGNAGTPIVTPLYSCATSSWSVNYPAPNWPVGTTTVTYTVIANNKSASCSFAVTVVDLETPVITTPANIVTDVAPGACGKVINFTEPVGTDNCTNGLVTYRATGLPTGSLFPIGTTVQTYVVADLANRRDTAIFTITVLDTVKPIVAVPANVTTSSSDMCGTVVTFTAPTASDNSGCVALRKIQGYASGETFPLGTTTQMYEAKDSAGNVDTAIFTVTVNPNYPLQASCADNVVESDPVGYGKVVYYTLPGTTNQWTGQHYACPNVQIVLESGRGSGAFFPPGRTEEHYAFIVKGTGDTVRCQTNVIVAEFNPPMIDCGTTQTFVIAPDSGSCYATFALPTPEVNDGPNGGAITLIREIDGVIDTTTNTVFSPGFHSVDYRAIDYSSNSSYCSVYVQVLDDVKINNNFQGLSYCEYADVTIDPMITGSATGLTYEWITTDQFGNYVTISTDPTLHFAELHASDQKQYNFRVTDRCGSVLQGGEFYLQVQSAPATTLSGLNSSYCTYDSTDIIVSFSPAGGVLSGNGITGNKFNPRAAGKGRHIVTYAFYDNTSGCTGISRDTIDVFEAPVVTAFADSIYCINATPIQLPAINSVYTGTGISGTIFNPATAGGGNHAVTRRYTENGCASLLTQIVVVNTVIPNPTITAPTSVCEASGNYLLTVATQGGAWQGAALLYDSTTSNVRFSSRTAYLGFDTIVYKVTVNACTASDTAIIEVKGKSYNLPFTFPEYCVDDPPVAFDPIDKQYMGLGFTNNIFTPAAVGYRGPVFYIVVTTNNVGCTDTVFRLLHIRGGQLNTQSLQYVCEPGDSILVDLRNEYDSIRWWNGTTDNPKLFTDTGSYIVFLRDTMGCEGQDTMRIRMHEVPTNVVPTSVYACPSDSAMIVADSTFSSYTWSTGDTTSSIQALPGTYTLTVTNYWGCEYPSPPVVVATGPDAVLPAITCPTDSMYYVPEGTCSISGINLGTPIALDNCGLATVTNNAPSSFTVGINNVTWTARDNGNNTATCIQKIVVNDSINPYFTITPDNFLISDSDAINCSSILPDFTNLFVASDSCVGSVTITQSPVAGTFATAGATPVAITATDASGNTVTNYMLFFTQDTVGPNIACPGNKTGTAVGTQTTAVVTYTAPIGASNCTNATVQRIAGLGSGAAFPIGVTTERYVVTDANGATDTCSFTVTVDHVIGIVHTNGDGNLLKVMPVPATDRLTIVFESDATTTLQVKLMNVAGQAIFSEQMQQFNGTYNNTINIADQAAGTYILEILTDSELVTRKIVKL